MPRLTTAQWAQARSMWEEEGTSLAAVGRHFNVSYASVSAHKKDEGWSREGKPAPAAQVVEQAFAPEQTVDVSGNPSVLLSQKLQETEAELARMTTERDEARKEADEHSPVREVPLYETKIDVVEVLGEQRIQDMVDLKFGELNLARTKQGLGRIDPKTEDPARYNAYREEILQEFLDRRTKWRDAGASLRVVKMVKPDGTLVEIPVERQINNEAGHAGAGLWHYRDKGFKLAMPYFCQRKSCWMPARLENGKVVDGYCSTEDAAFDPYLGKKGVPGATTAGMIASIR